MSLGSVIKRIVDDEDAIRLKGGLAMRWIDFDEWSGTLSLSRIGKPPSKQEVKVVMDHMEQSLPAHMATTDDEVLTSGKSQVIRIEVSWEKIREY